MKKLLITLSPLLAILFVFLCILWGLKGALAFFGIVTFITIFGMLFFKWVMFVDEHIKD